MKKVKIEELTILPKDPNSPESQEFLRQLHNRIVTQNHSAREMLRQWKEEDRQNEIN